MNKQNVTKFFKGVQGTLSKHSPEILTGIGVVGMITTAVLAAKATPKAMELIEEEKERQNEELQLQAQRLHRDEYEPVEQLTKLETIKIAWKPYIPAIVMGTVSTACLIGASATNYKRNTALAVAYQATATTLAEYKEQVIESIGEKKERVIREKVAQKKLDKNPEVTREIVYTSSNKVWFVEPVRMKAFESDLETVRKVFNDLNYRMTVGMEEYISLSELYDELGIARTSVSDDLGWNLGKDGPIEFDIHPCTTEEGRPAFMLDYHIAPRRGFERLM